MFELGFIFSFFGTIREFSNSFILHWSCERSFNEPGIGLFWKFWPVLEIFYWIS